MNGEFFVKETVVAGQTIRLFSLDHWRWSSNQTEILELEKRREQIFTQIKKTLKREGTTFAPSRPRRRKVIDGVAETK